MELKKCPFCGCHPHLIYGISHANYQPRAPETGIKEPVWTVWCNGCGAFTNMDYWKERDPIIDWWNKRTV